MFRTASLSVSVDITSSPKQACQFGNSSNYYTSRMWSLCLCLTLDALICLAFTIPYGRNPAGTIVFMHPRAIPPAIEFVVRTSFAVRTRMRMILRRTRSFQPTFSVTMPLKGADLQSELSIARCDAPGSSVCLQKRRTGRTVHVTSKYHRELDNPEHLAVTSAVSE